MLFITLPDYDTFSFLEFASILFVAILQLCINTVKPLTGGHIHKHHFLIITLQDQAE